MNKSTMVTLMTPSFQHSDVNENQKKVYKKKMKKFRRKITSLRKQKQRAMNFMKTALIFDHISQREINQKYYRNKIAKLTDKEEKLLASKRFFKDSEGNRDVRHALKLDKKNRAEVA